jgi:hypothetical protein
MGSCELFCPCWLQTVILLISTSWVTRIIGVSHRPLEKQTFWTVFQSGDIILCCHKCLLSIRKEHLMEQQICLFPRLHQPCLEQGERHTTSVLSTRTSHSDENVWCEFFNMEAIGHAWLSNSWNVTTVTEEMSFNLYLILANLKLFSLLLPVATVLER